MDDADPIVPARLRRALGAAAEFDLEMAAEGFWPDEPDDRSQHREAIVQAARVVDLLKRRACTREQLGRLAGIAAAEQDPGRWPRTIEEADELVRRARLTRDLIVLRDQCGGKPTQDELDAPE